jgi:hypothetical protein
VNAPILETALEAHAAGLCVLPPTQDGAKRPDASSWTQYQRRLSTEQEIREWYRADRTGLGFVTGRVSGGLEMLEFEGRAVAEGLLVEFVARAEQSGLGDLVARIEAGYTEETPSGGIHFLYRVEGAAPNTKLARRPASSGELAVDAADRVKVLIETRGEGGYVVVAPSNGSVHTTKRPWRRTSGAIATIATIAPGERDALFDLCRSFDRLPSEPARAPSVARDGDRPGDRYNARADIQAETCALLERHGWTRVYSDKGVDYLRRPGKPAPGISASLGYAATGVLHVFSTSTDLEVGAHSAFSVYGLLEHGGDFVAAAAALEPPIVIAAGVREAGVLSGSAQATWRTLADVSDDPPGKLILGWLEDGPTLAYAAPGVGKGTTGAWVCVEAQRAGLLPLVYDAERRPREWARRVSGLGGDRSRVVYLEPPDLGPKLAGRPLWEIAPAIGDVARLAGADLILVDSIMPAIGLGEDRLKSDPSVPFLYVAALEGLGVPSLSFGHPPKGQPEGDPFGSFAWLAAMRLTWLGTTAEGDGHRIRWRPRKRNERGHLAGFLLAVSYGDDGRPCGIERADDEENTRDWILAALVHGARSVPDLADELVAELEEEPAPGETDRAKARLGRALGRMAGEGWVERLGGRGRGATWQLRERAA